MQIDVLGADKIPPGSILAFSVDGMRQHCTFPFTTPLKFPRRKVGKTLQVDLLTLLGRGSKVLDEDHDSYVLPVNGVAGNLTDLNISVKNHSQLGSAHGSKDATKDEVNGHISCRHRAAKVDQDYLDKSGLGRFVESLIQVAVADKPLDLFAFIQEQLQNNAVALSRNSDNEFELKNPQVEEKQKAEGPLTKPLTKSLTKSLASCHFDTQEPDEGPFTQKSSRFDGIYHDMLSDEDSEDARVVSFKEDDEEQENKQLVPTAPSIPRPIRQLVKGSTQALYKVPVNEGSQGPQSKPILRRRQSEPGLDQAAEPSAQQRRMSDSKPPQIEIRPIGWGEGSLRSWQPAGPGNLKLPLDRDAIKDMREAREDGFSSSPLVSPRSSLDAQPETSPRASAVRRLSREDRALAGFE